VRHRVQAREQDPAGGRLVHPHGAAADEQHASNPATSRTRRAPASTSGSVESSAAVRCTRDLARPEVGQRVEEDEDRR
jgi:hypothetical protein